VVWLLEEIGKNRAYECYRSSVCSDSGSASTMVKYWTEENYIFPEK
jgi:hypothetical protein